MKYGFSLLGISPRYYADVAAAAEESGFESIWLPEHVVFPDEMPTTYPYSESGLPVTPSATPLYDPWVALAYIACATSTLRLATQVFILPLRHPLLAARQIVTLDRLSGGRVIVGAGVGWLEQEFDALDQSFRDRGRRTDEMIPLMRRLWTDPVVEHRGEFFDFDSVRFEPKPLQKNGIPIEIGGASAPALRRAGRLGDGWVEIGGESLDDVTPHIETIQQHRREAGRQDLPFDITLGFGLAERADDRKRAADLGVTRLLTNPPFPEGGGGTPPERAVEFIREFGRNVISADES
ncbi:LLM class F420-dependent oxidoreductase [Myxococcota bacterium]|nr:LLM class F420-dependent oxidoreductase [Myxococcota bacterium]